MHQRIRILLLFFICFLSGNSNAQDVISLAGEWQFQVDRQGVGEKEGWFNPDFQFNDRLKLPASMTERMKGDDISVNTQWVGSLYDSSYYFNPYMEKYRVEGQMKLPFFLTPDKHYVGKAWYKRTVNVGDVTDYQLFLERPHIISEVWV
ncbi:MAG: beta-glucuronidase, partial [Prevotella sp.]|nr:beta-glucuronidase [Prevotella sp.]